MSARFKSLHPVHSEKRENTWSFLGQNASTAQVVNLLTTVDSPTGGTDCAVGSHVKWLFVEFNLNGVDNSGSAQVFHWVIYKSPNNNIGTITANTYDLSTKRWVMKRGMEMLPEIPLGSGGTVQTKRVFTIKIPRSFQRMADGDRIKLAYISTSASSINFCGISIFKYIQ